LGSTDQDHLAVTARFGRSAKQRLSDLLLVLFLGEVADGNILCLGPAMDGGHVGFAELAEGSRRGDRKATLPMKKLTHLPDRLQFGTYACRNRRSIEWQVSVM
jgi:hypothetical protein